MPTPIPPPPHPLRSKLVRKLGVVVLSAALAAVGLAALYRSNITLQPVALTIAAAATLGLLAGFAARWALRYHSGLLRGIAALAALAVGLVLLGLLTAGGTGVGPLEQPLAGPDWEGLGQVALGTLTAALALRAWPRREPRRPLWQRPIAWQQAARARLRARWQGSALRRGLARPGQWLAHTRTQSATPVANGRPARPRRRRRPPAAAQPTVRPTVHAPPPLRPRPLSNGIMRIRQRLSRPLRIEVDQTAAPEPRLRPWKLIPRRVRRPQPKIQISEVQEHRCPFCLEVVADNDPRGMKECSICHTRHHADCWEVTGSCQVPHYQA